MRRSSSLDLDRVWYPFRLFDPVSDAFEDREVHATRKLPMLADERIERTVLSDGLVEQFPQAFAN